MWWYWCSNSNDCVHRERVLIRNANFLQQSRVDTLVLPKAWPLWIMQEARWVLDRISCFVPVSCFITCGCRVTTCFLIVGLFSYIHFYNSLIYSLRVVQKVTSQYIIQLHINQNCLYEWILLTYEEEKEV